MGLNLEEWGCFAISKSLLGDSGGPGNSKPKSSHWKWVPTPPGLPDGTFPASALKFPRTRSITASRDGWSPDEVTMLWPKSSLGTEASTRWSAAGGSGQRSLLPRPCGPGRSDSDSDFPVSHCAGSAGRSRRTDRHGAPGGRASLQSPHSRQAALPPPAQRGPS